MTCCLDSQWNSAAANLKQSACSATRHCRAEIEKKTQGASLLVGDADFIGACCLPRSSTDPFGIGDRQCCGAGRCGIICINRAEVPERWWHIKEVECVGRIAVKVRSGNQGSARNAAALGTPSPRITQSCGTHTLRRRWETFPALRRMVSWPLARRLRLWRTDKQLSGFLHHIVHLPSEA